MLKQLIIIQQMAILLTKPHLNTSATICSRQNDPLPLAAASDYDIRMMHQNISQPLFQDF
jgi:hypothetical protein